MITDTTLETGIDHAKAKSKANEADIQNRSVRRGEVSQELNRAERDLEALGMATADNPEALQVNPARAEALLRGYFNTWAMYGLMLSDHAIFGKKLPEMRTDQMPVVRRFVSQEPAQHTKYEEQFYDMLGAAQRLRGTMRTLDTMGRSDIADRKEKSPMVGEAKPLERAQKNLAAIIKDMAVVRKDDNLTPSQKREKLDALTAERNALFKATVKDSKGAKP